MKNLNNYKMFESKTDIDDICRRYKIKNYTINDDDSIDVNGDVHILKCMIKMLPLKFNRVSGNFYCQYNSNLTSLEGCPRYVGGLFSYYDNHIWSMEGYPEYVGGYSYFAQNPIYSIVQYFIKRNDKDNLVELFNYYDIVQDMSVIYDRLKYFYEIIDVEITDVMLNDIRGAGYKIIY